jgi:tetratricopeptide (TPR) repeat protein
MTTEQTDTNIEQPLASQAGSGSTSIAERLQQNWKIVAGVSLAIVVALGGYFWYSAMQDAKNEEANIALSRIRPVFDAANFEAALTGKGVPPMGAEPVKGLQEVADEYAGTPAGEVAALLAGNALLNLGKGAEAQGMFERATGSDAPAVQVGALKGLAACMELAGSTAEAAAQYEKAATVGEKSGLEEACWLNAALCYEKASNKEKAGEIYRIIVKRYETSEVASAARGGLARLGMAID